MEWYVQLSIYIITSFISFFAMWQVDFNKFMRINRKSLSIIVYIVLSLALGFLLGKLFIEVGTLIKGATE